MNKDNKIADTELEIMKTVWARTTPISSSDIVRELMAQKGWKETTIYTLISRLVEKGFLTQQKQKQVSYYSPTISAQDYVLEQTHSFVNKLFGGDARKLISMLCESQSIGLEEIRSLRMNWEEDTND
ncbi:MAG: BlaI/MecI/CopY family transcriptional regulator [Lachnospiraceae bacterium]|jgi:predicted transcriptional regulator|nr:BlaI/MecI/CopY family transcriptional regulator [Lachnospiraceae bacterium]